MKTFILYKNHLGGMGQSMYIINAKNKQDAIKAYKKESYTCGGKLSVGESIEEFDTSKKGITEIYDNY